MADGKGVIVDLAMASQKETSDEQTGAERQSEKQEGIWLKEASQSLQRPLLRNILARKQAALRVECQTWHRDSHELFDYESRHIDMRNFSLEGPCKFFRSGTEITCQPEGTAVPETSDYLLCVRTQPDGSYVLCPAEKNLGGVVHANAKKLWLIVRDLATHKHPLQENDIVKLGRFKLRVKQLCRMGDTQPEIRLEDTGVQLDYKSEDTLPGAQCRICLLETCNDPDDPLICPCDCKGSIQYVHVECLKHWINGKLNLSPSEQRQSYFLKHIQCELCKSPFPTSMKYKNECVRLLKVPQTDPPFIVLENMVFNRGVHVISMAEKKDLKIGRGHESDVRIPDVSISRHHATIRYANGQFLLEDHNSKFGTLVALKKAQPITDTGLAVQVGRSIINFSVDKTPKK